MTIITDTLVDEEEEIVDDQKEKTIAEMSDGTISTNNDDDLENEKKTEGKQDAMTSVPPTVAKLLALIRDEIPLLILGLVLMCCAEAATLATPIIIGKAYDALQTYFFLLGSNSNDASSSVVMDTVDGETATEEEQTMAEINLWMGISIAIFVGSSCAGYARGVLLGVVGERLVARLRAQTYASVLQQEIGFFDAHKTGEIVSRLGNDTQLLQQTVSTFLPESLIGTVKVVVSLILMFSISSKLTGLAFGGMFVLCLICIPFGKRMAALAKLYQDVLGDAQTRSTEALGNIRTVQSFAAEPKELHRYLEKIGDPDATKTKNDSKATAVDKDRDTDTTYTVGVKKVITQVGFYTVMFGGGFGFLYCSLWYGFYLVTVDGSLSLGGLSAFQSYIFIIGGAIGQTANNISQVFSGLGATGRVFYLLERQPKIVNFDNKDNNNDNKEDSAKPTTTTKKTTAIEAAVPITTSSSKENITTSIIPTEPMEGNICFENVMFSYPTRPDVLVLNAFTLNLRKNTTTALVGSSGSGKSTVVNLIQRFYDIDSGSIRVDNNDITDINLSWLRSQIGYVQQEPQLFGMSIRDNLVYGLPQHKSKNVTDDELDRICRDANAYDFIQSWPEKYNTMVGERGITLSGGQKQRIAIARALLTDCRILLLDEATSALDAESEFEVQTAIERAMIGRTVVVVAHRLSTIQCADQIVVMDNHKIVDVGTHDDLFQGCRRYQDLIKRQSTMTRDVSTGTLRKMLPANFTIDDDE